MNQSSQPSQFPRVVKAPPILRVLLYLMGPGLLLGSLGMIAWIHNSMNAVARAEIVSISKSDARTGTVAYSPEFSWNHEGRTFQKFSKYASNRKGQYEIGQTLEIRFDPDNPQMVSPNTFWSLYGFAALTLPISLLLTLAIFIRIRAPG